MTRVTITRGGSGKWVAAYSGCGYGDIASGHVPVRVGDWERVAVRQMTRQADGEPDPGVYLGGGHNTIVEVPDDVVERLVAQKRAEWEERERIENQRWEVTFTPLKEGLDPIESRVVKAESEHEAKEYAEFAECINRTTLRGPVLDYGLTVQLQKEMQR